MDMFLLSLGLGALPDYLQQRKVRSIGFVPTAGDVYEDPSFVRADHQQLTDLGYDVRDIDLANQTVGESVATLKSCDAVYVAGGNTFYLLQEIKRNGFDSALVEYVESRRPYVGASAGAVIIGPSIEPVKTIDDPSVAKELSDFTGLGLTGFMVLPHYGKEKYLDLYQSVIEEYQSEYEIVALRDDEALLVSGRLDYEQVASSIGQ
jgi:dipeptidase E